MSEITEFHRQLGPTPGPSFSATNGIIEIGLLCAFGRGAVIIHLRSATGEGYHASPITLNHGAAKRDETLPLNFDLLL